MILLVSTWLVGYFHGGSYSRSQTQNSNFRLIERLMGQVARIMSINELSAITAEVVEAARETLVIGT
jgi:hypothetical protein